MAGEACGVSHAERGNDRERIGGHRDDPPRTDAQHRGVGAGTGAEQDVGARRTQMGRDGALEDLRRDLAERLSHGAAV